MEMELKALGAMSAGDSVLSSVDPIVCLLNYRDQVNVLCIYIYIYIIYIYIYIYANI